MISIIWWETSTILYLCPVMVMHYLNSNSEFFANYQSVIKVRHMKFRFASYGLLLGIMLAILAHYVLEHTRFCFADDVLPSCTLSGPESIAVSVIETQAKHNPRILSLLKSVELILQCFSKSMTGMAHLISFLSGSPGVDCTPDIKSGQFFDYSYHL